VNEHSLGKRREMRLEKKFRTATDFVARWNKIQNTYNVRSYIGTRFRRQYFSCGSMRCSQRHPVYIMKHQVTASIKLQGQASHQVMEAYGAGETNPSWSCFVPQKGTLQTLQEYKMTNFQPDKRKKKRTTSTKFTHTDANTTTTRTLLKYMRMKKISSHQAFH
jgi:hypothetical protein